MVTIVIHVWCEDTNVRLYNIPLTEVSALKVGRAKSLYVSHNQFMVLLANDTRPINIYIVQVKIKKDRNETHKKLKSKYIYQ